jgi:SNF2 family DNA or RNA helicase
MALLDFICSSLKTPHNRWSELLKSHLQHGNIKSLQLVLRHVMLRRFKKLALPDLPSITHHQVQCQLNIPSQDYYNHHFSKFLTNFDNPKTKGRIIKENNFFSQLQSLRGICDHPLLANPNMTLTEEGNFSSDSVFQNQLPSSNKNYQRIEHKV